MILKLLLIIGLFLFPTWSRAATFDSHEGTGGTEETGSFIDTTQKAITKKLRQTADRLDSFFGDERIEEESKKTDLTLSLSVLAKQNADLRIHGRAKLKLSLPNLKNRLQIIISREQEAERELDELLQVQQPAIIEEAETTDWSSSLRLALKSTRRLNINIDAGVRFGAPLIPFSKVRYRKNFEMGQWDTRFTQRLAIYKDSGWEESTRLDFERALGENYFFRASSTGSWFEEEHGYFVTQQFAVTQRISRYRFFLYEWTTSTRTGKEKTEEDSIDAKQEISDFRVVETFLGIRYRQTIGWPWLFGEISPGLGFPRDRDYKATGRITFKIEIHFRDLS